MGVSGLDLPPSGVCDRGNGFTVGITIPLQIVRLNHLSDTECCQRSVDFFELLNSPTSDS